MSDEKMTSDRYAEMGKQLGEMLREMFREPCRYAAYLRSGHDIEMMKIIQPKAPRSRKRETSRDKAIRAGAWATKFPFMQDETIDPIIKNALKDGNASEVFTAISEGARLVESKDTLSSFARHVITALTVAIHIMENENTVPTEERVRSETQRIFEIKKWPGFQDEISRWNEFFSAAGLADLPSEKKPRGPAKHGDSYTEGRRKTKTSISVWSEETEARTGKKR